MNFDDENFINEVQDLISNLSRDELANLIMNRAADISPKNRNDFLQKLQRNNIASAELKTKPLLDDAMSFYHNMCEGFYDNNSEKNWSDELDILFARTDDEFLQNEKILTARVYKILFEILHLAEDLNPHDESQSAEDLILTDIHEAKAKYFRSLVDTHLDKNRENDLLNAMLTYLNLGSPRTGIQDILNIDPRAITNFDSFLKKWNQFLILKFQKTQDSSQIFIRWLIREGIYEQKGTDGLYELGTSQGQYHPEIFYDLVEIFMKENNLQSAFNAAETGFNIVTEGKNKAVLADWMAEISEKRAETQHLFQYRNHAWKHFPSHQRLLKLYSSAQNQNIDLELLLTNELSFLLAEFPHSLRLICQLKILLGEYEDVLELFADSAPLGWSDVNHPGAIVFPTLLILYAGFTKIPHGTSLECLCNGLEPLFSQWQESKNTSEKHSIKYTNLLFQTIKRTPPKKENLEQFLEMARIVILNRTNAVLKNRHEHVYENVAMLIVAYAEACYHAKTPYKGEDLISFIRIDFVKYSKFRDQMRTLFNNSPLLPTMNKFGIFS